MNGNTTQLFALWREGDLGSRDRLIASLLPELEQIAAAKLRRDWKASFSSHELINEAVERLIRVQASRLAGRAHFLALSSRLMRNILVDHARAKSAGKRQHQRIAIEAIEKGEAPLDLKLLDSALIRLGAIEPALSELVEMRYFGGMTIAEISEVTGWSQATVKRRWEVARTWLADAMNGLPGDE